MLESAIVCRGSTNPRCEQVAEVFWWRPGLLQPHLAFGSKNTTQNRAYDPGARSHVLHVALSLYLNLWNPGEHMCDPSPCVSFLRLCLRINRERSGKISY